MSLLIYALMSHQSSDHGDGNNKLGLKTEAATDFLFQRISISLFKDKDVKIYSIASLRSMWIKTSGPWLPVQARIERTEILIFCNIY